MTWTLSQLARRLRTAALLALATLLSTAPGWAQSRLESEFKLEVPEGQLGALWAFLQQDYGPGGQGLAKLGAGFSATFSVELFVDRYYDTKDLRLLKDRSGLRHRSRSVVNGSDSKKDVRQLVQLKLSGDNSLIRDEQKFEVRNRPGDKREASDHLPCVGLVKRPQRSGLLKALTQQSVRPEELQVVAVLVQTRSRVYLSRDGQPFSTVTLDHVMARHWYTFVTFDEVELELNEIAYTQADPAERASMSAINEKTLEHLKTAFPGLRQDQEPKYNKAMDRLARSMPTMAASLVLGVPPELFLLALLGLLGPLWLYHRAVARRRARSRKKLST